MATMNKITVGALGGPETFAGQATEEMQKLYPQLGNPQYFPGGPALFAALDNGTVEAIIVAEQTTSEGFSQMDSRVAAPNSQIYVIAEAVLPFACPLLGKPGARLEDIRRVYGGPVSIHQGKAFLDEHLPNAEVIVYSAPLETAQEVANGDGTLAILGTRRLIQLMGLAELAGGIDSGSYGNWWAVSSRPLFSETPNRVTISGRFGGDAQLGDLVTALGEIGFQLATVYSQPSGKALFEYDYVLRFTGLGSHAALVRELSNFSSARLVGAFEARG